MAKLEQITVGARVRNLTPRIAEEVVQHLSTRPWAEVEVTLEIQILKTHRFESGLP